MKIADLLEAPRRESRIVYPPVETARFRPGKPGRDYLIVSELVSHKEIDIAVKAFNRLRLPLVIAGAVVSLA